MKLMFGSSESESDVISMSCVRLGERSNASWLEAPLLAMFLQDIGSKSPGQKEASLCDASCSRSDNGDARGGTRLDSLKMSLQRAFRLCHAKYRNSCTCRCPTTMIQPVGSQRVVVVSPLQGLMR